MSASPARAAIYLASRSPRRRELLAQIGVRFRLLARGIEVDETPRAGESPDAYVRRVCLAKVDAGWQYVIECRLKKLPLLAADTIVCVGARILGKPADRRDAARMLRLLSGCEHRVLSAVALKSGSRRLMRVSASRVRFRRLSNADIRAYVASGEATDKAGAYAIQGRAAAFVSELRGSYSGVMGLPLFETAQLLARFQAAYPRRR